MEIKNVWGLRFIFHNSKVRRNYTKDKESKKLIQDMCWGKQKSSREGGRLNLNILQALINHSSVSRPNFTTTALDQDQDQNHFAFKENYIWTSADTDTWSVHNIIHPLHSNHTWTAVGAVSTSKGNNVLHELDLNQQPKDASHGCYSCPPQDGLDHRLTRPWPCSSRLWFSRRYTKTSSTRTTTKLWWFDGGTQSLTKTTS